jgi:molybdopterin-biosynthesis enzyme MoeA-like protein
VRVVGDEERAIIDALNALLHRYSYVFTTGGIGPTHGDITADCVAKAAALSFASLQLAPSHHDASCIRAHTPAARAFNHPGLFHRT